MTRQLRTIVAAIRQLGYPREFRIDDPVDAAAEDLSALLALIDSGGGQSEPPDPQPLDPAVVRRLANVTWNLMGQVKQLGDTTFDRALKGRVDILTQGLEEAGIELEDFSGRDFDDGEFWDEIAGPEGRKENPVIVGMSKPRVRYRSVVVQRGIPIVEDRRTTAPGGAAG